MQFIARKRGGVAKAVDAMVENMGDHEHYCASYSSKEGPHVEGLVHTLADGLRSLKADVATRAAQGAPCSAMDVSRKTLHRLISSTNRRMHKGFPKMIS